MVTVSVCMPIYNGSRFLGEAIDSVLSQDFEEFELIVVDDRSSDESEEIVRSYDDPRIAFFKNAKRLGIPGNWNAAMDKARGTYIKFCFQDDVLYPDCLSTMVGALRGHSTAGLVFSRRDLAQYDGLEAQRFHVHLDDFQAPLRAAGAIHSLNRGKPFLADCIARGGLFTNFIGEPSFVMFAADLIPRTGHFDSRLVQNADYDYWYRLLLFTDCVFVDRPLGRFRLHAQAESSKGESILTRFRYVREERIVLDNLLERAKRQDAQELVGVLEAHKRWFYVYRFVAFVRQRRERRQRHGRDR